MTMRLFLAVTLAAISLIGQSSAQWNGCKSGFCAPRQSAAYVGPVDINGTPYAIWSTRCSSTSYTGNVADIVDTATGLTHTVITCSAGGVLNTSSPNPLSTTCATACSVTTWYDQSGSNKCGGSPCNGTQATLANMPTVSTNCQNSKICFVFARSSNQILVLPATNTAQAQSISFSIVAQQTNTAAGSMDIYGSTADTEIFFDVSHNFGVYANGGAAPVATAANNAPLAIQLFLSGASTKFFINSSLTNASASPGTDGAPQGANATIQIGTLNSATGKDFNGRLLELGEWAGDKSANNATMEANQRAYWNF